MNNNQLLIINYQLSIIKFWGIILMTLFSSSFSSSPSMALPLSPGDRVEVSIPHEQYFARTYQVNQNGELEVPFLGAVGVAGLEPIEVEHKLSWLLVDRGYFPPDNLELTVQVLEWSPIQVSLTGELFEPGLVSINDNEREEIKPTAISTDTRSITGGYSIRRNLTNAIQAAGGILPTANLRQIRLIRQERARIIDLSGVFTGEPVEDVPLIAGDRIIVPATNFQAELVRPTQITPPGMKVFVSNLTVPASNNASSSISNVQEGITFPYGSRFSQAVIATNCAGGTKSINANRHAVLVRVDRLTGETNYLDRPIEDLLRNSTNEAENPLLMPRDGVACYDSSVTNTRDIFKTLSDIFSPFFLLRTLF